MGKGKLLVFILGLGLSILLVACSSEKTATDHAEAEEDAGDEKTEEVASNESPTSDAEEEDSEEATSKEKDSEMENMDDRSGMEGMDHHSDMVYKGDGEVPEGLKTAEDPKFPVGSKAISTADHMGGMMENVEATIVGAYDTIAYGTTYTSTTTDQLVKDHKWIVHEEIVDAGKETLEPGTEVSTTATHMKGMKDAVHTIEFSEAKTVYMIDFTSTKGKEVTNHKWVTEDELKPLD